MNAGHLAIFLIFGFPFVVVGGVFLIWALKITRGGRDAQAGEEETRIIQEIHQGLVRMEERVEALETILLAAEREREKGQSS